jgi:hypothetical protein
MEGGGDENLVDVDLTASDQEEEEHCKVEAVAAKEEETAELAKNQQKGNTVHSRHSQLTLTKTNRKVTLSHCTQQTLTSYTHKNPQKGNTVHSSHS